MKKDEQSIEAVNSLGSISFPQALAYARPFDISHAYSLDMHLFQEIMVSHVSRPLRVDILETEASL